MQIPTYTTPKQNTSTVHRGREGGVVASRMICACPNQSFGWILPHIKAKWITIKQVICQCTNRKAVNTWRPFTKNGSPNLRYTCLRWLAHLPRAWRLKAGVISSDGNLGESTEPSLTILITLDQQQHPLHVSLSWKRDGIHYTSYHTKYMSYW